ncbi:MAG TPA: hypothetical protein VM488_06395 [Pseudobacter sp.]|nr:hypothetical protein [Pseudobacter sp.]
MNRIFTLLSFSLVLAACGGSKFRAPVTEDKPLFAAINELIKRPDNAKAQNDLKYFFDQSVARHEEAVAVYRNSADPAKWDRMIKELDALQKIYTATVAIPNATNLVQPKSYLGELQATREDAAEFYYQDAMDNFEKDDRQSSLKAYDLFRRSSSYVNGYKDANNLSREAWENSIVNVVVMPVREDYPSFFREWDEGSRYRADLFQEQLVRELGGRTASYYPARFFTDLDLTREYIKPDWVLDVKWDYINTNTSIPTKNSRQVSKSIQVGKDSTGKPTYETVRATITTTSRNVTVRGTLNYRLYESYGGRSIDGGSLTDDVSWTDSYSNYTGDKRALSDQDRDLMRARNFDRGPSKTEVMDALMRKMFPDLRRRLERPLTS